MPPSLRRRALPLWGMAVAEWLGGFVRVGLLPPPLPHVLLAVSATVPGCVLPSGKNKPTC